ncbi:MAG: SLC13/DASS family transporter [Desulfobacterales bacterium]|nr:MAG: SLC13/DASS family transporter [Desulfobacterales bacterium]
MTDLTAASTSIDWKKMGFLFLGVVLFVVVYWAPPWPDAVDPLGKHFELNREAKGALAVFLLAGTWWVFEVVPIGITSLAIGVLQALFLIRPARDAFTDFMVPSVMFIYASIMIGLVFTKTGLTRRLAYRMLVIVGEKTSMIYLGCFIVTSVLTHIMAHTAVAATIYPLLVSIYALYGEGDNKTKFGKGLFIGMAYVAGAGSIITLLGAARGAVALGFYKDIMGKDISFFQLTYYMFPIGWLMTFALWGFFMLFFKPGKATIPGLRERARQLNTGLGSLTRNEIKTALIVGGCILAMALREFIPVLKPIDKTAIILISTILFFITNILDLDDLESLPWNIILLFAGAMSIGNCLWQTGAANWLAVNWLVMFQKANWFVFVMSIAFFVMIMTNFIMNVAAIAISLPVALVIAPYLSVAGEVILFAALVTAGMPFLLLVGAAPNAIAYDSGQFSTAEFFLYGIPASILLMIVTGFAVFVLWPLMGMPVTLGG